jgi:hypothetical protein
MSTKGAEVFFICKVFKIHTDNFFLEKTVFVLIMDGKHNEHNMMLLTVRNVKIQSSKT